MLKEISKCINEDVFAKLGKRSLTVFLVGAGQESPNSIRESIRKELTKSRYYNWLDVYYPENLFEELMGSKANFDLLSLENLLAKSVHAVVIILESPGAIAELGAFSNHAELSDRLVVVINKKYRKDKSFIILGPVRYLIKKNKSVVIFHNLGNPQIEILGRQIREAVRKISKDVKVDISVANPVFAQYFLLSVIYVMEPVQKEILNSIVQAVGGLTPDSVITIVTSSLNILLRKEEVILRDGKYLLTREGLERLRLTLKLEPEGQSIIQSLDKLRVKVLNKTLRKQNFLEARRGPD